MNISGVDNPGSLCYMIAAVQQLYLILELRSLLYLTQRDDLQVISTLSKLFEGLRTSGSSQQLLILHSFMNNGVDDASIFVQQDVSDFLRMLLTLIIKEGKMINPSCDLLDGALMGELCNSMHATSGESQKQIKAFEKFLMISVAIGPTRPDLPTSLSDYIKETVLPYRWKSASEEGLGPPESTVRTTKFKRLPNVLMFHIKRFRYDSIKMRKVKIHDRFEFPRVLDMTPYMIIEDSSESENNKSKPCSQMFELTGCIIHKGSSAYRGHYYSIVRVSEADPSCIGSAEGGAEVYPVGSWLKLDDERVTALPDEGSEELEAYFRSELYGGEEIYEDTSSSSSDSSGDDGDESSDCESVSKEYVRDSQIAAESERNVEVEDVECVPVEGTEVSTAAAEDFMMPSEVSAPDEDNDRHSRISSDNGSSRRSSRSSSSYDSSDESSSDSSGHCRIPRSALMLFYRRIG